MPSDKLITICFDDLHGSKPRFRAKLALLYAAYLTRKRPMKSVPEPPEVSAFQQTHEECKSWLSEGLVMTLRPKDDAEEYFTVQAVKVVLDCVLRAVEERDADFFRYIAGRLEAKGEPTSPRKPVLLTLALWLTQGRLDLNKTYTIAELSDMLREELQATPDPTHVARAARDLQIKVSSRRGRPPKKTCGNS